MIRLDNICVAKTRNANSTVRSVELFLKVRKRKREVYSYAYHILDLHRKELAKGLVCSLKERVGGLCTRSSSCYQRSSLQTSK